MAQIRSGSGSRFSAMCTPCGPTGSTMHPPAGVTHSEPSARVRVSTPAVTTATTRPSW